jgi:hypothetical protein
MLSIVRSNLPPVTATAASVNPGSRAAVAAALAEALDLDPGFVLMAPAQQIDMLRAIADVETVCESEATDRLAELRARAAVRRALPREMRRIRSVMQLLPDTDQREISAALRSAAPGVIRALVVDLELRDPDRTSETSIVAGLLRGLLTTLRSLPTALLAVRALLLKQADPHQSRQTSARPPDRPVPKQARPGRLARCPHGPDLLAVGRPRHRAGVPALRAA